MTTHVVPSSIRQRTEVARYRVTSGFRRGRLMKFPVLLTTAWTIYRRQTAFDRALDQAGPTMRAELIAVRESQQASQ